MDVAGEWVERWEDRGVDGSSYQVAGCTEDADDAGDWLAS